MDSRKTALVTGASSGIGREIARVLSEKGYDLILTARSGERLRKLAEELPGKSEVYAADLSRRGEVLALSEYIRETRPDAVVNNAGFGLFGDVSEASLERTAEMIDVNVTALTLLTQAALSSMTEKGEGRILNVASSAGLLPGGPHMAVYYATKAYVTSFTGAAAQELAEKKSRVTVSALCPGPVDTDFNRVAGVRFALPGIDAKACALAGVEGMLAGKTFIVPEMRIRAAVFGTRFLPRKTAIAIISGQQKKKDRG
ncbi:MAG: SDR family oxidoreductase [Clostridiales bacterium]|nr:SDR family oxidoreductase [Clostridiales bacterium]